MVVVSQVRKGWRREPSTHGVSFAVLSRVLSRVHGDGRLK